MREHDYTTTNARDDVRRGFVVLHATSEWQKGKVERISFLDFFPERIQIT